MVNDNFLLAFNGLGLIWLIASGIGLFFLFKFREERPYHWLAVLCCFFTAAPIVLLIANYNFPLSENSNLLHLIVLFIVFSFIALYFHTLDLLDIRVSKSKVMTFFGSALLLAIPKEFLHGELAANSTVIRTLAFHGSSILLLVLSIQNLMRVQKKYDYLQIRLAKNFLIVVALLFSCRVLYGVFDSNYLVINPHENVDFLFFLIRLLLVIFGGLSLIFLISMQKYHLIRIYPNSKYNSLAEYDVSTILNEREELINSLMKTNKTMAIGAVSTGLAHELNQPLSVMNINISLLKKDLKEKAEKSNIDTEIIDDMEKSLAKATSIVKTVKNLSIQNDSPEASKKASIQLAIEEILKITHHNLITNQIDVHASIVDCELAMSRTEVEQVILNIVSNAINALKKSRSGITKYIRITAAVTMDNTCEITIANNGGTIPEDIVNNLFRIVGNSRSDGAGIGLWLTNYILEKNLSKIRYLPIEPDITQFIVSIPLTKKLSPS